jgi:hypothetical protein
MGVDGRLFKNLKLNGCMIHHLKWITPIKDEPLPDYAMRLSRSINTAEPFVLIGVSFGGMCCIEIAKQLHPVKTFVISSCKKSDELPLKILFWKHLQVYKKISDKLYIKGAFLLRRRFGVVSKDQSQKFMQMLQAAPPDYFSGAVHCIMRWQNQIVPKSVVHIHGTSDRVLPFKKITCDFTIEGGTHFMIVNRSREINEILNKELEQFV